MEVHGYCRDVILGAEETLIAMVLVVRKVFSSALLRAANTTDFLPQLEFLREVVLVYKKPTSWSF